MRGRAVDAEDFLEPDELQRTTGPDLVFKDACESCAIPLTWIDPAFICDFECTWCPDCAEGMAMVCPNCSGELRRRPKRTRSIG